VRDRFTVLVADPDLDEARKVADLLGLYGLRATWAATPLDALRLATSHQPAVAVLNVTWPGRDGFELGRAVRRLAGGRARLLGVTGRREPGVRAEGPDFEHVLLKPRSRGDWPACWRRPFGARTSA